MLKFFEFNSLWCAKKLFAKCCSTHSGGCINKRQGRISFKSIRVALRVESSSKVLRIKNLQPTRMTGEVAVESCVDSSSQIQTNSGYSSECMSSVVSSVRKAVGKCTNFHHLTLWVSNARQYALHFCVHFGFSPLAYSGLETGDRQYVTHVVKQNRIILAFMSPLTGDEKVVNEHITKHGDGVQDIAFEVDCIETLLGN